MTPTRTCILIANDYTAKFFLNLGPGKDLSALPTLNLSRERTQLSEIVPDEPGRVFDSFGSGRHAMEPHTDVQKRQASAFIKMVIHTIEEEFIKYTFDRIILVAPPKTMSKLRHYVPDLLRDHIRGELLKDLTSIPSDRLGQHLDAVFPTTPTLN